MITIDFVDEARIPAEKPTEQQTAVERKAMHLSDRFKNWVSRTKRFLQRKEIEARRLDAGESWMAGDGCFWKTASLVDRYVQRIG
jgi:hypothetical protein